MTINAYINFKGNCREAVEYYGEIFNVEPKIMTFGDMPEDEAYPMTDDMKKLVAHANLTICGNQLMFSDVMPDMEFICGNNISISIQGNDKEQLTGWYQKISEQGKVIMPMEVSSWSELYAFIIDKYGIGWQFNYQK